VDISLKAGDLLSIGFEVPHLRLLIILLLESDLVLGVGY